MAIKIPFQVGITGGIGSGKSIVARLFSMYDVPVYESDTEARKLYLMPEIREKVIHLLGSKSYNENMKPDTAFIAGQIYADPVKREKLNSILHPAVALHYQSWLKQQHHPYVLKVAALLFEADIAKHLDYLVLIISTQNLKEERVEKRDRFRSKDQIQKIMESQWNDEKKIPLADSILYNDEDHSLIEQVDNLNRQILTKASTL